MMWFPPPPYPPVRHNDPSSKWAFYVLIAGFALFAGITALAR